MKNPYLLPGLCTLAGFLGFVVLPDASTDSVPGVLCAVGIVWLIYTRAQRRKP